MIPDIAKRLGISSEKTIRKAQEYERLLRLKTAGSGFRLHGVAQMVICLDLAVTNENQVIDKEAALKLSGFKKPAYNATKQTIKQVLELNKELTVKDICVQVGCPEIITEVLDLLQCYSKQNVSGQDNLDHPGFKAAAIMALSKVKKLGVDKARLHDISGLKKSVFDKLTASMVTLRKEIQPEQEKKVKSTKRSHTFVESVEARAMAYDEDRHSKDNGEDAPEIDFAAWKRRMLEEAKSH